MTVWLLPATGLVGTGVILAYAIVLFDAFGGYALPPSAIAPGEAATSYLRSPYWLGLSPSNVGAVVAFQSLAAAGYVAWIVYVSVIAPPTRGLLANPWWLVGSTLLFLTASTAWPFAAHQAVLHPSSLGAALGASACLWLAAAGVVLMLGGTFEARYESAIPLVGVAFLAQVVVLLDGVGWSAVAIFRALHGNGV